MIAITEMRKTCHDYTSLITWTGIVLVAVAFWFGTIGAILRWML